MLADRLHARWVVVEESSGYGHRHDSDMALWPNSARSDFEDEGVPLLTEHQGHDLLQSGIRDQRTRDITSAKPRDLASHAIEVAWSAAGGAAGGSASTTANLETVPHTAVPADERVRGWLASLDPDGQDEQR